MLHGADILDANLPASFIPQSHVLDHLALLQTKMTTWHHHMHFPGCAINPHPGKWSISVESPDLLVAEAFETEPVDILREVEVLYFAKLQVKEMIASNLKLDEQILKQIEQIATLKAQLDALRNGLTLEALGIPDPDTFFDDSRADFPDRRRTNTGSRQIRGQ